MGFAGFGYLLRQRRINQGQRRIDELEEQLAKAKKPNDENATGPYEPGCDCCRSDATVKPDDSEC